MLLAIQHMQGQLTGSVFGQLTELDDFRDCITMLQSRVGRLIFNQVPTGVEVCLSMQHGGPFPATTDSRFTSVGADGIKRFARPITYQNWNNELLPDELKNENPLKILRRVNGEWTGSRIQ